MNDPRQPSPGTPRPLGNPQPARPAAQPHQPGLAKIAPMPVLPLRAREDEPIELEELTDAAPAAGGTAAAAPKIQAFGVAGLAAHADKYKRKPAVTGQGSVRLRTFHGRLSDEGLAYMDSKVNEWLDEHPEIEVKFVTSTVGPYEGKIKEPALVMNVWY